jgi:putative RNA 2'-phosphotransferase
MPAQTSLVRLSKFLSLVLRHHPERIGLQLDENGWADVAELLQKARQAGVPITKQSLDEVVDRSDKKRFAFSEDGKRIRASHGHSVPVDLQLTPVQPPDVLYHGTARKFLDSIRRDGLSPGARKYVHLAADAETALSVGQRHGKPLVLTIEAGRMQREGHVFYHSSSGIWLTDRVPASYLVLPSLHRE